MPDSPNPALLFIEQVLELLRRHELAAGVALEALALLLADQGRAAGWTPGELETLLREQAAELAREPEHG